MKEDLEQKIKIAEEICNLEGVLKACELYSGTHGLFSFNRPINIVLPDELNEGFIEVIKQHINKLQKQFEDL